MSETKYDVVFVLGGPGEIAFTDTVSPSFEVMSIFVGAGKGTNCAKIVTTFGYTHLSTYQPRTITRRHDDAIP